MGRHRSKKSHGRQRKHVASGQGTSHSNETSNEPQASSSALATDDTESEKKTQTNDVMDNKAYKCFGGLKKGFLNAGKPQGNVQSPSTVTVTPATAALHTGSSEGPVSEELNKKLDQAAMAIKTGHPNICENEPASTAATDVKSDNTEAHYREQIDVNDRGSNTESFGGFRRGFLNKDLQRKPGDCGTMKKSTFAAADKVLLQEPSTSISTDPSAKKDAADCMEMDSDDDSEEYNPLDTTYSDDDSEEYDPLDITEGIFEHLYAEGMVSPDLSREDLLKLLFDSMEQHRQMEDAPDDMDQHEHEKLVKGYVKSISRFKGDASQEAELKASEDESEAEAYDSTKDLSDQQSDVTDSVVESGNFAGFDAGFLNNSKESLCRFKGDATQEAELKASEDESEAEAYDSTKDLSGQQSDVTDSEVESGNFAGFDAGFLNNSKVSLSDESNEVNHSEESTHSTNTNDPTGLFEQVLWSQMQAAGVVPSNMSAEDLEKFLSDPAEQQRVKSVFRSLNPHTQSAFEAEIKSRLTKMQQGTKTKVKDKSIGLEELVAKVRQNKKLVSYFQDSEMKEKFDKLKTCSPDVLNIARSDDSVDMKCVDLIKELGEVLNELIPDAGEGDAGLNKKDVFLPELQKSEVYEKLIEDLLPQKQW